MSTSDGMLRNLAASSMTGALVMLATNPLDTLKQRWQILPAGQKEYRSSYYLAKSICNQEGFINGLWRPALLTNIAACSFGVGARLGFYPTIRDAICDRDQITNEVVKHPAKLFASGLVAGSVGYLCASPFFYVKTMIQTEAGKVGKDGKYITGSRAGHRPSYKNGADALMKLARKRGIKSWWTGAELLVLRGGVMSAAQTSSYDIAKTNAIKYKVMDDGPFLHFFSSLFASVVCVTFVIPFDVTLTRYQASYNTHQPYSNVLAAAKALKREGGWTAFGRGWNVMWCRMGPSSILSFFIFEQLRQAFGIGYMN